MLTLHPLKGIFDRTENQLYEDTLHFDFSSPKAEILVARNIHLHRLPLKKNLNPSVT